MAEAGGRGLPASAGFISGLYVVLTTLIALALFRVRVGVLTWTGVGIATIGLALLSGVHAGAALGDVLVLAGAAVFSLQIVLMERYALLGRTRLHARRDARRLSGASTPPRITATSDPGLERLTSIASTKSRPSSITPPRQ